MSTLRSEGTKEDDDDDEQMSSVENVKTVENFYAVILVLGPIILLIYKSTSYGNFGWRLEVPSLRCKYQLGKRIRDMGPRLLCCNLHR